MIAGTTALSLAMLFAASVPSHQEVASQPGADCAAALILADRAYEIGLWDDVLRNVDTCLATDASREHRVRSYALQAKTLVLLDRLDDARAAIANLIRWDASYAPGSDDIDPPIFVSELRRAKARLVRSVSGFLEDPREAPATVIVVTAEQIKRRGYLDLEAVLHDLPGFDISRANGDTYSTIYQRGYRANATDRMLLIIDGIEQNDLHSNVAYLSRQYPLSNVDRIEVVYGPASTIYGPNAYSGVINVITKDPESFVGENNEFAVRADAGGGAFGTGYGEISVARVPNDEGIRWSATARLFKSAEQNLTGRLDHAGRSAWDYDLTTTLQTFDYAEFTRLEGFVLDQYLASDSARSALQGAAAGPDPLVRFLYDDDGEVEEIRLADAGVARARAFDASLVLNDDALRNASFEDPTQDYYVGGKLYIGSFTVGAEAWRRKEGTTPMYVDTFRGSREGGGGIWAPQQTTVFARYQHQVGNWRIGFAGRYKNHQLDDASTVPIQATYASGYLDILDLIDERESSYHEFTFDQVSSQYRAELTGFYEPSTTINGIVGLDLRDSSLQADFLAFGDAFPDSPPGASRSFSYFPSTTSEDIRVTDTGLYSQWTVNLFPDDSNKERLKFVGGLRVDHNEVRENQRITAQTSKSSLPEEVAIADYGTSYNPRVAVVFAPTRLDESTRSFWIHGSWVFKFVFSQATQQPPSFQRFATEPLARELPSPFLEKEETTSMDFSVDRQVRGGWGADNFSARGVLFVVDYDTVLQTAIAVDPCCIPSRTGFFSSIGGFGMWGAEAMASWERGSVAWWANYTYTKGFNNEDPRDEYDNPLISRATGELAGSLRIGDIARHQFKFGVNLSSLGPDGSFLDDFNLNIRANAIGDRRVGPETTSRFVPDGPIPSYFVTHLTLGYEPSSTLTLQLLVNNIFDVEYWHPGVRTGGLFGFASSHPQPGASVFGRVILNLGTITGQ